MLLDSCLSVCPVCDVGVLWPNGWMDQDATWYGGRPRPLATLCQMGAQLPSPKSAQPTNFRPMSVVAKWLDGSKCHLVGRYAPAQETLS